MTRYGPLITGAQANQIPINFSQTSQPGVIRMSLMLRKSVQPDDVVVSQVTPKRCRERGQCLSGEPNAKQPLLIGSLLALQPFQL
jgi:hypothetical protein